MALLGCCLLFASTSLWADRILYDEDAASQWRQMDRAVETPDAALTGRKGLRLTPTAAHTPMLRISPGRTDFRAYDVLEFDIRATQGPMQQRLWVSDYAEGTRVDLADYIDGGVIDRQWRQVSIPVRDLASKAFPLDRVFLLYFDKMTAPQSFDIDNMVLRVLRGPRIKGTELQSQRAVTVFADEFAHDAVGQADKFRISSDTDKRYGSPRAPVGVGSSRQAIAANEAGSVELESRLHLLLPEALLPGHRYRIRLAGLVNAAGNPPDQPEIDLMVDPVVTSPSIQVNQVGYAPTGPKLAYVGGWLGDFGPMPVDATRFQVIELASGRAAFEADLRPRVAADVESGSDLYEADFSALRRPGHYRLAVPGIGFSLEFEIGDRVYDPVYRTVARFFYHRRNTTLKRPFVDPGFERTGINPRLDGVFHPVVADYPLRHREKPFAFKPIVKGWFDAGDYGEYIHNAAPIWGAIGVAFDLAPPGHFRDAELEIPESGNAVPDLLDELGWGMDWALSMQDANDGGIYWRLSSGTWDMGLPADVREPRFIYEKTTRATAQFAAMGAIYARLIKPYDKNRARKALDAARSAWHFLQVNPAYPPEGELYQNPKNHPGGGAYAVRSALPAQHWAAAELYRTTGEPKYQDAYRALVDQMPFDVTAAPEATFGHWAMVMSDHASQDMVLKEQARRTIMIAADMKRDWSNGHPYRVPKHPNIKYSGWHTVSGSAMQALPLLQGYHLTGAGEYLELAWLATNMTLGANPLSRTFITGTGSRPPRDPMDRISLNDGVAEPVRGMPVPGITWHLPGFREPYKGVNAGYYPPDAPVSEGDFGSAYPVLRRYIDSHALIPMNEGTVREAGLTVATFGLLRDANSPPRIASRRYDWSPGAKRAARVFKLQDIPLTDVPRLTPAQIRDFGDSLFHAPNAWLQALTSEQIAAMNARQRAKLRAKTL